MIKNDKDFQRYILNRDGNCFLFPLFDNCSFDIASAHHIIKRRFKKSRLDDRNGVGLCQSCHNWAHSKPIESELIIITKMVGMGIWKNMDSWEKFKRDAIK